MLILILAVCLAEPVTSTRLKARAIIAVSASMPVTAKTATCRCGDACPMGGKCEACSCAKPSAEPRSSKPEGDGWRWDADGGYWWRPVTPTHDHRGALPTNSTTLPDYRPIYSPLPRRFLTPAPTTRAAPLSYSMPRAASCST